MHFIMCSVRERLVFHAGKPLFVTLRNQQCWDSLGDCIWRRLSAELLYSDSVLLFL